MITERQTNITLTERGIYKHLFEYYFDILPIGSNLVRIETPSLERANMDIHSLIEMGVRQKDFTVGSYRSGEYNLLSGQVYTNRQSGEGVPSKGSLTYIPSPVDLVYINSPLSTIITDCRQWLPRVRYAGYAILDNLKSINHLVVEYMHIRNNGPKVPEWQLANNINGDIAIYRRL